MDEVLTEIVSSRDTTIGVDRQSSVIRGVKLLGLESRNGRRYLPAALSVAVPLYEGAKVNLNHPKGNPLAARDYQDRLGVIRGVSFREGLGLFGDLHFNPKHLLAEQLQWDAEHAPENVGFSHNVLARTARNADELVVEKIMQVQSVDLVADPATTRGLFESTGQEENETILQLREELLATRQELDALRCVRAVEDRRSLVRRLLAELHLPDPDASDSTSKVIVSEAFMETLLASENEEHLRRLIADRARLVRQALGGRPCSQEQQQVVAAVPAPMDAAAFAAALLGR